MKARLALTILLCSILSACAGPSLRYKKDVNSLFDAGKFDNAAAKIEANRSKAYGSRDKLLYLLDLSAAQNAAHKNEASNRVMAAAQQDIDDLYTKSIARGLGTLVVNDYTQPYRPPLFEWAQTYFIRGLDFLSLQDKEGAAVEARRAVFLLDKARESQSGYNDDAFVQYFSSMIFEDTGNLSSARIARANAMKAYERQKGKSAANAPDFPLPPDFEDKGELVLFHLNGKVPYKISRELMFAWNDLWFTLQDNGDLQDVSQDVINAAFAGAFGRSVTVSFPALAPSQYMIETSAVSAYGAEPVQTQLVSDIAAAARQTLDEEMLANHARMITRAVTKYILSVQARHAAQKAAGDTAGDLAGILFSVLSNITEKADTRSWFTLPAEIRMASMFLEPGIHNIKITFYDRSKNAIDEHLFEKVQINKGERTYIYHRTAK